MPNQQATDYVKNELGRGVSPDDVRSGLLAQGWALADIDAAFEAAGVHAHVAASFGAYTAPGPLMGVRELFAHAWGIFKKRFWVMLGVVALGGVVAAVVFFGGLFMNSPGAFYRTPLLPTQGINQTDCGAAMDCASPVTTPHLLIFWSLLFFICFLILTLMGTALLFAVRDDMTDNGVFASYRHAFKKFLTILWVSILSVFAVMGGMILFVIPGIIAAIWLVVVRFVIIIEGDRGMDALAKSKSYVAGRWWTVCGLTMAPLVVYAALMVGIDTVLKMFLPGSETSILEKGIIGMVQMLAGLYLLAYTYALYKSLRSSRPEVGVRANNPQGALTALIAISVIVIMGAIVFLLLHSEVLNNI